MSDPKPDLAAEVTANLAEDAGHDTSADFDRERASECRSAASAIRDLATQPKEGV